MMSANSHLAAASMHAEEAAHSRVACMWLSRVLDAYVLQDNDASRLLVRLCTDVGVLPSPTMQQLRAMVKNKNEGKK